MNDEEFWLEIGVNTRLLDNMKSSWFRSFKQKISELEVEEELLKQFFKVEEIYLDDTQNLKELFKKEESKIFYGLFNYIREKILYLKDFFRINELDNKYIQNPFLGLIYLYLNNKDLIVDSYYYVLYQKTTFLEKWIIDGTINIESLSNKIRNNFSQFTKELKLGENRISRIIKIKENKYLFCFEKGKKEGVIFGYREKRNLRKRGIYFFLVDLGDNSILVRSGNPKIGDLFFHILESENYKVFVEAKQENKKDLKELSEKLLNYNSDKAKITEIEFNSLNKGINCNCKLKESDEEITLNDCLKKMIEEDLIDPQDIENIRNFVIELGGSSQKIILKRNKGDIFFNLTNKSIPEKRYNEIIKILRDEFGIETRVPYQKEQSSLSKVDLLQNILRKRLEQLNDEERELYTLLAVKNLLKSKSQTRLICKDNPRHKIVNHLTNACPECGGEVKSISPREYLNLDELALLKHLKEKLENVFSDYTLKIEEHKIDGEKKNLILFRGDKTEFYLYLDNQGAFKKIIKKLERSLIPTIKIVIDKKTKLANNNLRSELYAYNLIFDSAESIKKEITENLLSNFERIILDGSKDSKDKLTEIHTNQLTVTGDDFEDICYPLLKYLFYGIYKWGVKQKGKPVPDGLYGIGNGQNNFSLIYDCKYSDGEYKLTRGEKIKAKDYVKRTNQSSEIVNFSNGLSAYMILSNNVNQTQFDNLSDLLFKLRSWNGKVILLQSDSLLKLYSLFDESTNLSNPLRLSFGLVFADYIKSSTDRKIVFDDTKIQELFDKAKELTPNLNELSVLNHLETDIEY